MGILVYRDSERGNRLLGRIDYEVGRSATFQYDDAYVADARPAGELGVSERLPLDSRFYDSDEFSAYFQGLLPEGEVLEGLANLYQVPRNDYLGLMERLGCESIGALTFVSEEVGLEGYDASYLPLEGEAVQALVTSPVRAAVRTASETRLSLSGAQSKVAWFLSEGLDARGAGIADWLVPQGGAPSTHIVKMSRRGEEEIALNELACSRLAVACGIETAEVSLVLDLPGAIAVRRYDREWMGASGARRVLRLHQEDFCQALGLSPYFKYQPEGAEGAYLCMISDLLDATSDTPLADKREFAKRLLFSYAVGNSDAHLKNSSLLYNRAWTSRRLAPLYDVTCIPLAGYSTDMAFDVGVHRRLDEIDERDLLSIALDLDIALGTLDQAASEVLAALEAPSARFDDAGASTMADRILENARPRLATIRKLLGS